MGWGFGVCSGDTRNMETRQGWPNLDSHHGMRIKIIPLLHSMGEKTRAVNPLPNRGENTHQTKARIEIYF